MGPRFSQMDRMRCSTLAIIPARGRSKGVPRKNIRDVAGKPLIAWTIEEAQKSRHISHLLLSSEDEEIMTVARRSGCACVRRPDHLATDTTTTPEVVLDVLQEVGDEFSHVVVLQPTSPLRTVEDIDRALQRCLSEDAAACVTVCEATHSPLWTFRIESDRLVSWTSHPPPPYRQALPSLYILNGAVYVAQVEHFKEARTFFTQETVPHVMPQERSLDIDTEFDLTVCALLLSARQAGR